MALRPMLTQESSQPGLAGCFPQRCAPFGNPVSRRNPRRKDNEAPGIPRASFVDDWLAVSWR